MNALPTRASTKHLRADVTAIPYKRLLLLVQRRHHCRKALAASHRVGVVGAQAGLADGQGALVQAAGGVEVALVGQDDGEVAQAGDGVTASTSGV
jgi:hypothetical protein